MIARQLNTAGIEAFRQFLAQCREDPKTPIPENLLEDDALSSVIAPAVEVESRRLKTKAEAAHYLVSALNSLPDQAVENNAGLWTWLTLYFFDDVCPLKDGARSVKVDYYYIFEPEDSRRSSKHLLHISWRILKSAPTHNRLLLTTPLSSLDQVTAEVMKRLYFTRIPCMFEVLDRLYWDETRGRARPGIVNSDKVTAGDLKRRLPSRIRQLEKTYDLLSLTADQLIELLGNEFRRDGKSVKPTR